MDRAFDEPRNLPTILVRDPWHFDYRLVMEIALLVFLVVAVIVSVLVTRARGGLRRTWDDTDAWDALKRVGDKASKKSEREDRGDLDSRPRSFGG